MFPSEIECPKCHCKTNYDLVNGGCYPWGGFNDRAVWYCSFSKFNIRFCEGKIIGSGSCVD